MQSNTAEERFNEAAMVLPPEIREKVYCFTRAERQTIEEFRLRAGQQISCVFPSGERIPAGAPKVRPQDLERVLEIASEASFHTVADKVKNGFVTMRGGHRIGMCGTTVVKNGEVSNLRQISSLCIRIAKEVPGAARELLPKICRNGMPDSTLLLAPPGAGKTTLLRDIIRMLSNGEGIAPMRVGVADERGELAAMYGGLPQMDVGRRTDVVDGCPKAVGLMMLLRGMAPQVLTADEITAPEDVHALEQASGCGTVLMATAHGYGVEDLRRRPVYREMMVCRLFQKVVLIRVCQGVRKYEVLNEELLPC